MKAQFCVKCGAALDEKGCCQNPECATFSPRKETPTEKVRQFKSFQEKDMQIVPDCVQSDQDEVPIKQYDIARLQTLIKGAFAEGRLQVTNKRVLFRSVGNSILGPTSLQYEFSLEEIAGVEIRKETRFSFLSLLLLTFLTAIIGAVLAPIFAAISSWGFFSTVFSLLMSLTAVFFFFFFRSRNTLRQLVLAVPFTWFVSNMSLRSLLPDNMIVQLAFWVAIGAWLISLLHLVFAPNLVVNIKTKGGTPSIEIRRKDGLFSFQHDEYTGFAQVLPGPDADMAMKEIGALIREVQQTGTYTEK